MSRFSRLDPLLLLMTLIWGTNYSIIKAAFGELDPQVFNAIRMTIAALALLASMVAARKLRWNPAHVFYTSEPLTRRDWAAIAALGLVGHCTYQFCFIGGVARTSVANSSLLLALSPLTIALLSAAIGQDRVGSRHWAGILLSLSGIYIVVGHGARLADSLSGDVLIGVAVVCWTIYTVGARPLMHRHSPVGVTALSMAIGTSVYAPLVFAFGGASRVGWAAVSLQTWIALVYSAVFAIGVSYVIWYAAVRELGSARTAVYSNLLPVIAMVTALIWLHEPLGPAKLVGAAAVLAGLGLTRVSPSTPRA